MSSSRSLEAVYTENPVEEMWNRLLFIGTMEGARGCMKKRIEANFFGLDTKALLVAKTRVGGLDATRSVSQADIEDHALELSFSIRQARELYSAANNATELTKPLLYYYGMISLSHALIRATYSDDSVKRGHGLEAKMDDGAVKIRRRGVFSRFHDCYETDPSIYANETRLTLQEIFSTIPELNDEYRLVYERDPALKVKDPESVMDNHHQVVLGGTTLSMPALTSHFLAMFYLSSVARYRPKQWGLLVRGDSSTEIHIVRKFFFASARRFPNVILNELWGTTHMIYAPARLG